MSNIYYSPEDYGLKVFASAEQEPDYDFSMFVVWVDEAEALFYGEDAGCSCPAPFEDVGSVEELQTIVGADGLKAFFDALTTWGSWNESVNTTYVRRKVREYMTK